MWLAPTRLVNHLCSTSSGIQSQHSLPHCHKGDRLNYPPEGPGLPKSHSCSLGELHCWFVRGLPRSLEHSREEQLTAYRVQRSSRSCSCLISPPASRKMRTWGIAYSTRPISVNAKECGASDP